MQSPTHGTMASCRTHNRHPRMSAFDDGGGYFENKKAPAGAFSNCID
jgi:hypothetical protein